MCRRFFMHHRLRISVGRRMFFVRRRVVTMRTMCRFGVCSHCDHRRTEGRRVGGVFCEIAFAPINKTVKRDRVILAPDEQSERQKEQRQSRCQNFGSLNAACQINRKHNGDPCKGNHGNREHQRMNTIGKGAQEAEHNEYTKHCAESRQTVLQGRRACISHIELIGKRDGAFCIKDFGSGPGDKIATGDQPKQDQ